MTAAVVVLAVALAGTVAALVTVAIKYARANDTIGDLRGNLADTRIELADAERESQDARHEAAQRWRQYEEERARNETRVRQLRAEIEGLEADLAKCATPESVAARLNRLQQLTAPRVPAPAGRNRGAEAVPDGATAGADGRAGEGAAGGDAHAARPGGAADADR